MPLHTLDSSVIRKTCCFLQLVIGGGESRFLPREIKGRQVFPHGFLVFVHRKKPRGIFRITKMHGRGFARAAY